MAYLVGKTSVDIISDDAVDIRDNLPAGFYKLEAAPMRGFYLDKADYNTAHGKIYGKSDVIASHVADAYEKSDRSLGVLFSGGKGLGKSLTTRLIIEKLMSRHPVIIINKYIDGMFDFLEPIKNVVYLFDEFEKTMRGNVNEQSNNNNATTKQDQILTFLDGTASGTHNLFLFTVNEKRELNDNLLSRPGRIRYHYQFESCDADTIRNYCKDNLEKPELESEIVDTLTATRYVSLDIVRALVDEVNTYDVTVSEAMNYLNIDFKRISLQARVTWALGDVQKTYTINMGTWIPGNHEISHSMESHDEDDDDGTGNYWYLTLHIDMDGKTIPLVGSLNVTKSTFVDYYSGAKPKILNVEIFDEESARFEKFQPVGLDI
jgi:SpoVK/Ycf46/Vps4 family AAA+-type ATPase